MDRSENTKEIKHKDLIKCDKKVKSPEKKTLPKEIHTPVVLKDDLNEELKNNRQLINNVFENMKFSPIKIDKKKTNESKEEETYLKKSLKSKKSKKSYSPLLIKERMYERISKTLKQETVNNLKGLLSKINQKDN